MPLVAWEGRTPRGHPFSDFPRGLSGPGMISATRFGGAVLMGKDGRLAGANFNSAP
jgi:hypothetical protein